MRDTAMADDESTPNEQDVDSVESDDYSEDSSP
jgi:hypothetical protein